MAAGMAKNGTDRKEVMITSTLRPMERGPSGLPWPVSISTEMYLHAPRVTREEEA